MIPRSNPSLRDIFIAPGQPCAIGRGLNISARRILVILIAFVTAHCLALQRTMAAEALSQSEPGKGHFIVNFSDYTGGPVDKWLDVHGFKFEKDAKNRKLLGLSIAKDVFTLEAKGRMSGFILNDSINLDSVKRVRINWGIKQYPADVSYKNQVNNEALMLYIFFGAEKVSSGHILIPNSPYFIGLFLCQDEQINVPYKGRYFHTGGRFVCLGKPDTDQMIVSEFDLDRGFKNYFGKNKTPGITGIGFGVDTSKAGNGGKGAAFIKSIEFFDETSDAKARGVR